MRLTEIERKYYHGSMNEFPVGFILTPRDDYENDWQGTNFYWPLEKNRPRHMMSHKQSVFMCDNDEDVDLAGGGTNWLFVVQPLGKVEKHDHAWGSEISMLVDEYNTHDHPKIKEAALNYWYGVPHPNENVWEYLAPKAKIIHVEEY